MHTEQADSKKRFFRFVILMTFTGLGTLMAWLLFDFKSPGGLMIMGGLALGCFINLGMNSQAAAIKVPSLFEFRSQGRWPLIRKVSAGAFLVFFCMAPVFISPKLIANEGVRKSGFLLCSGLGLLGGTPIVFALKSNLRLLGYCSLFMAVMFISVGLLGILQVGTPPFVKMLGLTLGVVASLIVILFYLRRKESA